MQRVYRSDLRCPHCGSNGMPKAGFSPTASRLIAAGNATIATARRAIATIIRPR